MAALASGVIDRAPLSLPIIVLVLGLVVRPNAVGLTQPGLLSPLLAVVAAVNLALVLFLDAARLDIGEVRHE